MNQKQIEQEAMRLERLVNERLRSCWPTWSHLVRDRMAQALIDQTLKGPWEFMRVEAIGRPLEIKITQYLGTVDDVALPSAED